MKTEGISPDKERQELIIRKYKQYLRLEKGLSENTYEAYQMDLEKLLRFLEGEEKGVLDVTSDDLERFIAGLHDIGIHPRSQARILSGLKSFFHFLILADYREDDPCELIEGPKIGFKLPEVLTVDEIDAIIAAVRLSSRYITDRFLPDKAIDLMDEAAARLRMQVDSLPEELDECLRKIKQLEIEREAIKMEGNTDKVSQLDKEIATLKEEQSTLTSKWEREKNQMDTIQQNKAKIENLKFEAEQAERDGNYERVAMIRYGEIQELQKGIDTAEQKLHEIQGDSALIKEVVDAEDIAEVVSKWTNIPVSKMMTSERTKLLHLEKEIHKRVVGQDEAIEAIANAVRRSRAGLQDAQKPIGSFLFLGTTGVGKTEVARALADFLFDDQDMMTRIDMSEYQEKHSASRLVGAPPGYVGYEEGGQLTEAIRRKPYSVVLFDEIEKAHPDVFNVLLQVLDDGRLTDNKGRTVNFKNTIIIMTSNMGSDIIQHNFEKLTADNAREIEETTEKQVLSLLKERIRPEFLNRIDETIVFHPLNKEQIAEVVRIQLDRVIKSLAENGITLTYTDRAVEHIAELGFDPQYGARPVKRVIQKEVMNPLSIAVLEEKIQKDKAIQLDYVDNEMKFINQSLAN